MAKIDIVTGPGDAAVVARALWSLGDYPRVAKDVLTPLGLDLVECSGIRAGLRVLDVAAGAGNVAIPAAARGADVLALDITPELLEAGEREAAERGLHIEWVEGDAQSMPFDDGEFDVVASAIGAMFAPDHQRTADELVRVCAPGGTIALLNWAPEGAVAEFFKALSVFAPPPAEDFEPPTLWGNESHVRNLLGDRVEALKVTEKKLTIDHFESPNAFCDYYKHHFGPTIAAFDAVAHDPDKVRALDHAMLENARRSNLAAPGAGAVYELEYVLMIARKCG